MPKKPDLLSPIAMEMVCQALIGERYAPIADFGGGGSGEVKVWAWVGRRVSD